jgi:Spy/CpxP family protein refolding chaperone
MAGVLLLLAAAPALGQRPSLGPVRGGPSPGSMLRHKAVQEELKLSKEQRDKVKGVMTAVRDKMIELIENGEREKVAALLKEQEKGLTKVLTATQFARLKQVVLQVHGLWAMTVPDTAKDLKLTPGQVKQLRALQAETEKQMNKVFEEAATRKEAQKRVAELHRAANDKGLALLTEGQRARWKAMIGEPFKGEIQRVPPGGDKGRR